MSSTKLTACWKLCAASQGRSLLDIFPVCNSESELPREALDTFAEISMTGADSENSVSRSDFLLSIRVLKVIEQIVFSRCRTAVRPLQVLLSIYSIVESSPSWTSVLHALGLVSSYDSM